MIIQMCCSLADFQWMWSSEPHYHTVRVCFVPHRSSPPAHVGAEHIMRICDSTTPISLTPTSCTYTCRFTSYSISKYWKHSSYCAAIQSAIICLCPYLLVLFIFTTLVSSNSPDSLLVLHVPINRSYSFSHAFVLLLPLCLLLFFVRVARILGEYFIQSSDFLF